MFSAAELAGRDRISASIEKKLADKGYRFIQMEMPDINGYVRGKIATLKKGLSSGGTGMSTLTVSLRSGDMPVITPWSCYENGFPKMSAVPDYDTVVKQPWKGDTAAVLCDFYMDDGSPCPMDTRLMLKRVVAEYEKLGLEPRVAMEYEFYVFEADAAKIRAGRARELTPFGLGWDAYAIARVPSWEPLAKEFMTRMEMVGIDVEVFHTELGHGMLEYTFHHEDALKAADDAARAKLYFKQLCAEKGLVPTFMTSPFAGTGDSNSGCHLNISLWKKGKNACWDPKKKGISGLGRHFAGGVLETMPAFNLIYRPWVNSFRRMDRLSWNPENASWGLDNHTTGLRVVHGSNPEKHTRIEHRAPGSDVNPYLTIASVLLGGLHGIKAKLDPGAYCEGDAMTEDRWAKLPHSLPDSIAAFKDSALGRRLLGEAFVDHFAAMKTEEWAEFEAWAKEKGLEFPGGGVTDWEYDRYLMWA